MDLSIVPHVLASATLADSAGGDYFSMPKIVTILVLLLPWLYLSPHVNRDALHLRAPATLWSAIVLGAGAAGVLLWLLIPFFFVGLALYVVLVTGSMLAYVAYRNGRVDPEDKILTAVHLKNLFVKKEVVIVAPLNKIKLYDSVASSVQPQPSWPTEQVQAYNLLQIFMFDMLWRRASESDLTPSGEQARVRFVIDGVLTDLPPMSLSDSEMMIQFAKSIGGMNVDDYRRPQKGKIAVDLAGGPTEVVLASAGTTGGQRLQLRVRSEMIQTRLAELGMSAEVLQSVRAMCKKPGLILVSGRSDSGVTSTLYSLLREHDCFMQQIITFEKAPAIELENITQNRYDADEKLAPALVTALRRDPDVLMVDVCNDPASAGVLVEASNKKALLLGISAGDTFTALAKWIKTRGEAGPALKNLHGVLCQTLVRKLCPSCREPYKPDPQMLTKANLPTDKIDTFYRTPSRQKVDEKGRPIICQTCRGTGYFGRSAIFELLEVTDEVRQLAASGASLATIKASCRKNRMLYLQEQGLAKVISGTTSIQEVIRACASGKKS